MVELEDRTGKMKKQVAVSFVGREKRLGLNKTNAIRIADMHGHEVEGWKGKEITLIVERVEAFGEMKDAIRVQVKQPDPVPVTATSDDNVW